ncbi:MAG TPA: hypothetical protein VGM87_12625 [Roseomonas sp.]
MEDEPERRDSSGGTEDGCRGAKASSPMPVSATLNAAVKAGEDLGRKVGAESSRLVEKVSEQAAIRIAASLKPARDLGRSVESRRIAVENAVHNAVSGTAAKAKRAALGVGVYGAIMAGAAGEAAAALLITNPLYILRTGAKFLEVRREIAEALAKYDQAASDAAQVEREHLALEAVERLTRWDHRTTLHHPSSYLHVSVGPGKAEAWGMLLRGPHAGRSLASVTPEVLEALSEHAPDQETASALEAWRQAISSAARKATSREQP